MEDIDNDLKSNYLLKRFEAVKRRCYCDYSISIEIIDCFDTISETKPELYV